MIEFGLGVVLGMALGYAMRAWLSARRRQAARVRRIAAGKGERHFAAFRPPSEGAGCSEQAVAAITSLQPAGNGDEEVVQFRSQADSRARR